MKTFNKRKVELFERRHLRQGIYSFTGKPWVYGLLLNWYWTLEERLYLTKYPELEPYLEYEVAQSGEEE